MAKATQSFHNKLLKFSGVRGEDRGAIERNWPWPEPPLNCTEDKFEKIKKEIIKEALKEDTDKILNCDESAGYCVDRVLNSDLNKMKVWPSPKGGFVNVEEDN